MYEKCVIKENIFRVPFKASKNKAVKGYKLGIQLFLKKLAVENIISKVNDLMWI